MLAITIESISQTLSSWVWSPALVVLCLCSALYFSIRTRFVQVRRFGEMAKLLFYTDKTQKTGISSFQAFANSVHVAPVYVGVAVAGVLGLVIIGGVTRIAKVAQIVAPFMALLYIILTIVVLICNYSVIPSVLSDMLKGAVVTHEIFGGIIGSTIA